MHENTVERKRKLKLKREKVVGIASESDLEVLESIT